ncbi:MAG: DUF3795 domain-containing protein [Candidatus Thorarchaeota archaeon]|nr:MAG: DUF3795 domain-containing protein [Candidatus Thorarchaeota archaeon]
MTKSMIAYCGIDCAACQAHLAWKNDDDKLREKQAGEWGSPNDPLTAADINCVGCKADAEPKFKFSSTCSIRSCASERGVETCAHCEDYGCDTLEEWLAQAGDEQRQKLEKMRAAL